jgi:hypothetical protein
VCCCYRPVCTHTDADTQQRRTTPTAATVSGCSTAHHVGPLAACCTDLCLPSSLVVSRCMIGATRCWQHSLPPPKQTASSKNGGPYLSCASSRPSSASCCPRRPSRFVNRSSRRALAGPAATSPDHTHSRRPTASAAQQSARAQQTVNLSSKLQCAGTINAYMLFELSPFS